MAAICVTLITVVYTGATLAADSSRYRLIVLDVGEGQAILLHRGSHGVLLDTGHAGSARHVLDRLENHGVSQLDYLVLSHLHPDHASGYFRLLEAFPAMRVIVHDLPLPTKAKDDMVRWVAESLANSRHLQRLSAGDSLDWQGLSLGALWPGQVAADNLNDNSLIIEVIDGEQRHLIMGDASSRVEKELVSANMLHGPYDILVAGHHGSAYTSSQKFLAEVQPAYSIVSTNAGNIRGYPSGATLRRLRQQSRKAVYMTYEHGEICLEWNPGQNAVECEQ